MPDPTKVVPRDEDVYIPIGRDSEAVPERPTVSQSRWSKSVVESSTWLKVRWKFFAVIAVTVGSVGLAFIALSNSEQVVPNTLKELKDNLPLTLPVFSVLMAILLRPHELRTLDGWLKLCNPLATGLVSFSIWAFVAGQSVEKYIRINQDKVLDKDHALLLVFWSFIWAGFCSVITALVTQRATDSVKGDRVGAKAMQALILGLSVFFLGAPYHLFEEKSVVESRTGKSLDERVFKVVIPFRDSELNQYIGRTANPITQTHVYKDISARTADEARKNAIDQFLKSELSLQFVQPNKRQDSPSRVEVQESSVVAEPVD